MAIQTATSGSLEDVQNIIISAMRYTAEWNAPCANLVERFTLPQGAKQFTVPKLGSVSASDLTDGIDMTATKDLDISTTTLTCSEVGLKFIVTDKLVRQSAPAVFGMVGRSAGDAMARKREKDIIALFASLSNTQGGDGKDLSIANAAACVAISQGNYGVEPFPMPVACVHHPNAIYQLTKSAAGVGTSYYAGIMSGYPEERLRNFWKINVSGVNFLNAGNILKVSGYDSGYGAMFSKSAFALVIGKEVYTERERDASLRAWEIVTVSDYGVFELDDNYGMRMQYEIGNPATNA